MDWKNKLYKGDGRKVVQRFPEESIDLVVTSPPYNVGTDYAKYDDDIPTGEYDELIGEMFSSIDPKMKNTGRVCVNVSLKNDDGIIDIPSIVKSKAEETGWTLRFEIIWNKGESESSSAWGSWLSPSSPRPIFNHEYVLIFDVGTETRQSEQTMEKENFMAYVKSIWNIQTDNNSMHPATFPEEIPRRLIQLNSYENDTVLDPFLGSGTTTVVAEKMNRDWVGIDIDESYIEQSRDRMEKETEIVFDDRSIFDY